MKVIQKDKRTGDFDINLGAKYIPLPSISITPTHIPSGPTSMANLLGASASQCTTYSTSGAGFFSSSWNKMERLLSMGGSANLMRNDHYCNNNLLTKIRQYLEEGTIGIRPGLTDFAPNGSLINNSRLSNSLQGNTPYSGYINKNHAREYFYAEGQYLAVKHDLNTEIATVVMVKNDVRVFKALGLIYNLKRIMNVTERHIEEVERIFGISIKNSTSLWLDPELLEIYCSSSPFKQGITSYLERASRTVGTIVEKSNIITELATTPVELKFDTLDGLDKFGANLLTTFTHEYKR